MSFLNLLNTGPFNNLFKGESFHVKHGRRVMFSPREITISTTMLHWSIFRLLFDLCVSGEVLLHFLITLVVSLSVSLTGSH